MKLIIADVVVSLSIISSKMKLFFSSFSKLKEINEGRGVGCKTISPQLRYHEYSLLNIYCNCKRKKKKQLSAKN